MANSNIRFVTLRSEAIYFIVVICLWLVALGSFFSSPVELFLNSWPIILIAFISAIVANATAVGGGFIFLPLFTFFYDLSAIQSLKLALSTQAFGMTSGAISWPRHLIIWRYFFFACFSSSLGMVVGTFFWIPSNELIHELFGYGSLVIGAVLLIEAAQTDAGRDKPARPLRGFSAIVFFLLCVTGGLITSWISIGVGEVVAMWMLFRARFGIAQSVATGVAVLAFCSVLGFIFHSAIGGIAWHYLMFTSLGVIMGGRVGAKFGACLANTHQTIQVNKVSHQRGPGLSLSDKPLKLFVGFVILADGLVVLYLNHSV